MSLKGRIRNLLMAALVVPVLAGCRQNNAAAPAQAGLIDATAHLRAALGITE